MRSLVLTLKEVAGVEVMTPGSVSASGSESPLDSITVSRGSSVLTVDRTCGEESEAGDVPTELIRSRRDGDSVRS